LAIYTGFSVSVVGSTISNRYGRCVIGFGLLPPEVRAFKGHAAFQRAPEKWEY
jgi:hypothetical protein